MSSGRDWRTLTAGQFFSAAYMSMAEEAGGRRGLEEQLSEWVVEEQMKQSAKESSGRPYDVKWDSADRLALEMMRGN